MSNAFIFRFPAGTLKHAVSDLDASDDYVLVTCEIKPATDAGGNPIGKLAIQAEGFIKNGSASGVSNGKTSAGCPVPPCVTKLLNGDIEKNTDCLQSNIDIDHAFIDMM